MIVYIFGFLLSANFAYYAHLNYLSYSKKKSEYNNVGDSLATIRKFKHKYILFLIFSILPLGLISGLRYGIGTDYFYTYSPNFYKILNGEFVYSELGFNLLNKLIQIFSHKDTALFLVTGILFAALLIKSIVKYSNNIFFSFLVAFISCIYFISLNNVRQSIASVIMLAAFPYFIQKKTLKMVFVTLCGMLFHYTAIVIFFTYILSNIKFVRKNFIFICVLSIIILPIFAQVFEEIVMHTKYAYYFNSSFNNDRSTRVLILYNALFFILFLFRMYRYRFSDRKCYIFILVQFLAFWLSLLSLFIPISEMISRLVNFFFIFQVLSVPYMGLKTKFKSNRIAFDIVYITAYSAYMIYYIVIMGYHEVLPYISIFSLA